MKKVLIITFYFPPCGSSSTARNMGFAKHFKRMGLEPTVLTVNGKTFERLPSTRRDDSYKDELKELKVERTASFIPIWFIRLLYRIRMTRFLRLFFPFEPHVFWLIPGLLRALKIIRREKPDFILSTSLPNTPHLIGMLASKITGTKWIADFQDPMGYRFGDVWFTRVAHAMILKLEKCILKKASGITTQSKIAAEILLEKYPFLSGKEMTHVTNAYDGPLNIKRTGIKRDEFRIVHSGEFYADYSKLSKNRSIIKSLILKPLDWTEYVHFKADLMPHSADLLLRTISSVLKSDQSLKGRLKLVLNGYVNPMDQRRIKELDLDDTVTMTGMTGYAESLEIINSADLLYLPLFWDVNRERNYCIPGKVFPYIASLNRILAPIQDGDTKDIVDKSGLGVFPSPYDEKGMAESLRTVCMEHLDNGRGLEPDIEYIKGFSRSAQVKRMYDFAQRVANKNA